MALTSAEILPTRCLTTYRGFNTQYKALPIERRTCYHTKLLCTGSPLTAAAQPASLPFLRLTKVNGRASFPECRSADNGDTRKTRVQARINTGAGAKMHRTANPRIPRQSMARNIAEQPRITRGLGSRTNLSPRRVRLPWLYYVARAR